MKSHNRKLLKVLLNFANIVTYSRIVFVFLIVFLLLAGKFYAKVIALILILLVFWMDWLDGFIARRYRLSSAFGGIVDVAGDRIAENSLWIIFTYLHIVPLWAPLMVISRSFITDGVRSYVLSKGKKSTFEMMRSRLGVALVASRWSRGLYAASKLVVFTMLMLVHMLKTDRFAFLTGYEYIIPLLEQVTLGVVFFVVAFCVVRGALTLYDSRKFLVD